MNRILLIALSLLMLGSCGVKRPLLRPADVPAYEAKRQKKRQQYEETEPPHGEQVQPQAGPVHVNPPAPPSPASAAGPGAMSGGGL
jgi:predicted small lipoprotein YifL